MTINSIINVDEYSGDGSQTDFVGSFRITKKSDVQVILYDSDSGAVTYPTVDVDYEILDMNTSHDDENFTISFNSAPSSTKTIYLKRSTISEQAYALDPSTSFDYAGLEVALDRLCMADQTLEESADRSIKAHPAQDRDKLNFELPLITQDHHKMGIVVNVDGSDNVTLELAEGDGDVIGPDSSTKYGLVFFSDDKGAKLSSSTITVSDGNDLNNIGTLNSTSIIAQTVSSGSTLSLQGYKIPNTDGNADEVLTTDGSKNLGWTAAARYLFDLADVNER